MMQSSGPSENDAPLGEEVLRRHGLRRQPFATKATEGFVYSDPALDMPVGVLQQRLQTDNKPLLLLGEHGAGKSTQLLQLLSRGAGSLLFCGFKGRPGAPFPSIEYAIRQQWSKAADAAENTPLAGLLLTLCRGTRRPVLVIDDAHLLAPEVLAALLRLRREVNRHCSSALGILLAGEPGLEDLLAQCVDADTPAEKHIAVRLRPLTQAQTEAYLRQRLQTAGAHDPSLLSGAIAAAIHQESGGRPIDINLVANRYLQSLGTDPASVQQEPGHAASGSTRIGWQQRWTLPAAGGAAAVLATLVVVGLLYLPGDQAQRGGNAATLQQPSGTAVLREAPAEPPVLPTPDRRFAAESPDAEPTARESAAPTTALPIPEPIEFLEAPRDPETASLPDPDSEVTTGEVMFPEPAPIPRLVEIPASDPEPIREPAEAPASEPEPAREIAEASPSEPEPEISVVSPAEPPPVPTREDTPVPQADPQVTETPTETPDTARTQPTDSAGASDSPSADIPGTQPRPAPAHRDLRDPTWLQDRAADRFTIQIIAGGDLEALRRYAGRLSLDTEIAWFRTRRNDQDWYALVAGDYPDLAGARAAVNRLPAGVRRNQPWIRTFGSVQESMDPGF
ncbi:AAA family ATPase [Thioalkalivibrio sp.]|uniref:AAA family ATPase n=1 Tax=Thioalkalivibrio sp. TaxID=2093813 RepID=UPI0012D6CC93|nr:AAA family ATPase [Thioalkalivibrio sp.]TVP81623.1 MAG: sporulation protein [Thioalkalivibrio sp.]